MFLAFECGYDPLALHDYVRHYTCHKSDPHDLVDGISGKHVEHLGQEQSIHQDVDYKSDLLFYIRLIIHTRLLPPLLTCAASARCIIAEGRVGIQEKGCFIGIQTLSISGVCTIVADFGKNCYTFRRFCIVLRFGGTTHEKE